MREAQAGFKLHPEKWAWCNELPSLDITGDYWREENRGNLFVQCSTQLTPLEFIHSWCNSDIPLVSFYNYAFDHSKCVVLYCCHCLVVRPFVLDSVLDYWIGPMVIEHNKCRLSQSDTSFIVETKHHFRHKCPPFVVLTALFKFFPCWMYALLDL